MHRRRRTRSVVAVMLLVTSVVLICGCQSAKDDLVELLKFSDEKEISPLIICMETNVKWVDDTMVFDSLVSGYGYCGDPYRRYLRVPGSNRFCSAFLAENLAYIRIKGREDGDVATARDLCRTDPSDVCTLALRDDGHHVYTGLIIFDQEMPIGHGVKPVHNPDPRPSDKLLTVAFSK